MSSSESSRGQLFTGIHLTMMMTSAQIVETLATTTDNSPSQDYTQPDDQKTLSHVTPPPSPRFKPLTVKKTLSFFKLFALHHYFWKTQKNRERANYCVTDLAKTKLISKGHSPYGQGT